MKQVSRNNALLFGIICLLLVGCKVKVPETVIPRERMTDVLYDYHIAKAMGDQLPYAESHKKLLYIEYVFNKYDITQAQFDSSMVWYTRHTDILADIYLKLSARLKAEQKDVERLTAQLEHRPMISEPGDSIDVWPYEQIYRLTGTPMNRRLDFVIPADTNFHAGDTLDWKMRYRFLTDIDSAQAPFMALQIHYQNDSIIADIARVYADGFHRIRLSSDTLGELKEVRGFLLYPQSRGKKSPTLLLDSLTLMRYHRQDTVAVAETPRTPTP
ncbi:MAG: DUF4296 domain-containing protein [Prevotellaceae bacterium]|jgi:hypothetical protein|nr:DUF4296 domain-containing protein [Prevotellaceae bacterium]